MKRLLAAASLALLPLTPAAAGPVEDCQVREDPGPGSFEILPPTTNQGTNVTSDGEGQYARVGSNRTYYVVQARDGEVAVYGRRDGATNVGEPPRLIAFEISSNGTACVSSPALGAGYEL